MCTYDDDTTGFERLHDPAAFARRAGHEAQAIEIEDSRRDLALLQARRELVGWGSIEGYALGLAIAIHIKTGPKQRNLCLEHLLAALAREVSENWRGRPFKFPSTTCKHNGGSYGKWCALCGLKFGGVS